jgi:ribosomal protein S18 acetylase RimI-like enzyme
LHDPTPDLTDALTTARAWYAERGLPLMLAVPLPPRRSLDAALGRLGWIGDRDSSLMVAGAGTIAAPLPMLPEPVRLLATPDPGWLAQYAQPDPRPEVVFDLLTRHDRAVFASVELGGQTVGIARAVIDDGWLGLFAIAVEPGFRGRRLAQTLIAALADWGVRGGCEQVYLQVEQRNATAISLYRHLGFWEHHTYRYLSDPAAISPRSPTIA